MGKISGSYRSLIRGVSQQPLEQRLPGQHGAQTNMISDPVSGVTRRQGTTHVATTALPVGALESELSQHFGTASIKVNDREFDLHLRRPGTAGTTPPVLAIRKGHLTDGALAPVVFSAAARGLLDAGVNAHVVAGDYLLFAHTTGVTSTRTELLETTTNRRRVTVQVRGGAYSRKYRIKFKLLSGAAITAEYTTPASSYGGVLDTTSIAASDPAYTKKVNDIVNAYNGQVTAWIGTAAAAIQPNAIAGQLNAAFGAAGGDAQGIGRLNDNGTLTLTAPSDIEYVEVSDSGDGSLLKGVWQTAPLASDLPAFGFADKVVKIEPRAGETYYLKSRSDDPGNIVALVWEECSDVRVSLANMFCIGVEHNDIWCVGSSPSDLEALLDATHGPGHGRDVPEFATREAGDDNSNPEPYFVGRVISYLGMFQDRLLVGCGNVLKASLIGGYFSYFRTTALSVPDDDPTEVFATGTEGDVLREGVLFDKSLILFGDLGQYAVPGTVPMTPSTVNMMQSSRHLAAATVPPITLGNIVFYAKPGDNGAAVYQINVGSVDDTSNSAEVSVQLSTYLAGSPTSMTGLSSPDNVVIHLREQPNALFVFRFMDSSNGERVMDAWYKWEFHAACGSLVGVSQHRDKLRLHWASGDNFVVDEVAMLSGDLTRPHLDRQGPAAERVAAPEGASVHIAWPGNAVGEFRRWQGRRDNDIAALEAELGAEAGMIGGLPFSSSFTPTPPVPRDSNDAPITTSAITIAYLAATFRDTGGLSCTVKTDWDEFQSARYIGYTASGLDNGVGVIGLHRGVEHCPVENNVNEYEATFSSIDWLPLSVTSLDWVGQYFNRTRRM